MLSNGRLMLNSPLIFEDEDYWKVKPFSRDFFSSLKVLLPKQQSWSSDIDLYGTQDSNCLEVFFENESIYSIRLRIDFLSDYKLLLKEVVEFFIQNNLIIIDETRNILELDVDYLMDNIHQSEQYKKYVFFANK